MRIPQLPRSLRSKGYHAPTCERAA
jgi:hypothetical protein